MDLNLTASFSADKALLKTHLPSNYLLINDQQNPLSFQNYKLLGKFVVTKDYQYSDEDEDFQIRKLIAKNKWKKLIGRDLGDGYAHFLAGQAENDAKYSNLKIIFKWITKNDYLDKVHNKTVKKPDFICFGGRIADMMQTPLKTRFGKWTMLAARYNDCIFLRNKRIDGAIDYSKTVESFYGPAFEALMTGRDPQKAADFEQQFVVQEASLGSHQLLLFSEIDAMDENGDFVEIEVCKTSVSPLALNAKYLSYWAQSAVKGGKTLALGSRDEKGRLTEIKYFTPVEILGRRNSGSVAGTTWTCLEFQDRLFSWISSHFTKNDATIVKMFSFPGFQEGEKQPRVECSNYVGKESLFPEWFLNPSTE